MTKETKFKKEVLLDALKTTIATISILIENGCKDNSKLVYATNYYVSIALKSFLTYHKVNRDYTSKEMALKGYKLIYMDNFRDSYEDSSDLNDYFIFRDEFKNLPCDEQVIITAFLMLSNFYKKNNMNKVKNILNNYIFKLKNCIKNADTYYIAFNIAEYDIYKVKCILFKFLIENS
ncbi:MAG: hypothetical protein IJX34_04215 [Clostridia bacterium]|nr:hypothetical protein [Clostridia bacterium]